MFTLILLIVAQAPECRTSDGQLACGFHCRSELGEVKCAQTPQGICTRIEGKLTCWDPPEEVRLHAPQAVPHCEAKYRDIACGFTCETSPNRIACSQTPWGICTTRFDSVHCWDPSPETVHHFSSAELKGAKCLQTDSGFGCGWGCVESYQQIRCAQTPRGTCTVNDGRIVCFDPPVPATTHHAAAETKAKPEAATAEQQPPRTSKPKPTF